MQKSVTLYLYKNLKTMNKEIEIKLLKENDIKNLRVLKCVTNEYNRYFSYLFYFRDKEYVEIDELDKAIIKSLKEFAEVTVEHHKTILYEEEIERFIEIYKDVCKVEELNLRLIPKITSEIFDKAKKGLIELVGYKINLMCFFKEGNNFTYRFNNYLVYLDYPLIDKLGLSIETVDLE